MASIAATLADALATDLSAAGFSLPFEAARAWRKRVDRPDLKDLLVLVGPGGFVYRMESRAARREDYGTEVAVQKAVTPGQDAEIDVLAALLEEIGRWALGRRLPSYPAAIGTAAALAPASELGLVLQHLDDENVFTGALVLTWTVIA